MLPRQEAKLLVHLQRSYDGGVFQECIHNFINMYNMQVYGTGYGLQCQLLNT